MCGRCDAHYAKGVELIDEMITLRTNCAGKDQPPASIVTNMASSLVESIEPEGVDDGWDTDDVIDLAVALSVAVEMVVALRQMLVFGIDVAAQSS